MHYISILFLMVLSSNALANTPLPNNRHIAITGKSQLQATPDIAIINLSVESLHSTSFGAKKEVDSKVNNLLSGLLQFNVSEKDISASSISTEPNYTYTDNGAQQLEGYLAYRDLKVTLADIGKLNALLDFALSVKVDEIDSIELEASNKQRLQQEVTAKAIENAKIKASSLAEAFGAKLGEIYSINSSSNASYNQYGQNHAIERIEVTGSRVDSFNGQGKYIQERVIFSASISVVFDLVVSTDK